MTRPSAVPHGSDGASTPRLDDFVAAFEASRAQGARDDLADFLPERDHPLYLEALRELVRVDLELAWEQGRPRSLEEYRRRFPELFADRVSLGAIAFEEYRLRRGAGQNPVPAEYERLYGVSIAGWPAPLPAEVMSELRNESGERAADGGALTDPVGLAVLARPGESAPEGLRTRLPNVGEEFLGFQLVSELGRGAIGCVYLARQAALADRLVALKVAPASLGESQTLAQLQHTHIVPIYSVHTAGSLQAVCMPYFGRTTLADVLHDLAARPSLPQSGVELLSTLHDLGPAAGTDTASLASTAGPHSRLGSEAVKAATAVPPGETRESTRRPPVVSRILRGLSYVDAVLWLGRCLADGLAHAHERGIVHHDLKPANVLITDEGQPMLLDFNLAEDTKRPSTAEALVGGTLPYMAPEQLEALRSGRGAVDARGDLFSLGVLLYELLTRKAPFPARPFPRPDVPPGDIAPGPRDLPGAAEVLAEMVRDRSGPPPSPRRLNKAISPAVDAIIRRCLEPDPVRRYSSARQLQEDLQRQLDRLPLRYTREPSLRERARKWLHRHPRLALRMVAGTTLLLIGLALTFGLRYLHLIHTEQELAAQTARTQKALAARLALTTQALTALQRFREDLQEARTAFSAPGDDRERRVRGEKLGRRALDRFAILDNPDWGKSDLAGALSAEEQGRLRREAGDLLLLLARARALPDASIVGSEPGRQQALRDALALNRQAEECFPSDATPPALWLQRADLHRQLGERAEAEACRARVASLKPRSAEDYYLLAREHAAAGNPREAVPLLREATRSDPQSYWAWFLLGNCHDELGDDNAAASCYSSCIVLAPRAPAAYFNRGLAHLRRRDYAQARADFDQAIHLRPDQPEVYINLALALQGMGKYGKAVEEFTRALDRGSLATRIYFMRASARQRAGDAEGARRDREEGLRLEPADETSWVARGLARLSSDPAAALADFERALALNPRSRAALQNKAHVLAEKLNRPEEAIRALDQAVALYPDYVPARGGRGVVLARLGRRDAALEDARGCLARDGRPRTRYQVACIYALTSREAPADRRVALGLLVEALRQGYGFNLIGTDADLNPLRELPEFQRLAGAAAVLQAALPLRGLSP
jgi:serine/threonine protein kinase/Tfp pilus assembly protein PilF